MKRIFFLILLIAVLFTSFAFSEVEIFDLSLIDIDKEAYLYYEQTNPKSDKTLIETNWTKTGNLHNISQKIETKDVVELTNMKTDNTGKMIESQSYDKDNKLTTKVIVDYSSMEASVTSKNNNEEYETKKIDITGNTYGMASTMYIMGGISDYKNKEKQNFTVLVPYTKELYEFFYIVVDQEKISVPAGKFFCYKVELGIEGIMGALAPKMYYWIDSDTRILIKYSIGNKADIELVKFKLN